MSRLTTILGVAACKLTRNALRIMKRGGTTLPGRVALVFNKDILQDVSRDMDIIVVTGTNGKTTTCNMIEQALTRSGASVLANKSGANLLMGITAEFCANADWLGNPRNTYPMKQCAVIECDEGALKQVAPLIRPKVILVTNLFRDQLDRYGEVTHTLEQIRIGVEKSPESILCLNADCSLSASLAEQVPNEVKYYGIDQAYGEQKSPEISDAKYCIHCGTEYSYEYHTYAHLGGFYCPKCGYRRKKPDFAVTSINNLTAKGSDVTIEFHHGAWVDDSDVSISLPAIYNVYNALGAICAYLTAGYMRDDIIRSLAQATSSFGRMELFDLDGIYVQMILVKNPAGCNQAISFVTSIASDYEAVICLNDKTADGHDISWIWDAEYERLAADSKLKRVLVSGERAEDMALRLKYAGIDESMIHIIRGWDKLVDEMKSAKHPIYVLPNYTSMLALREVLAEETGAAEFWKG